MCFLLIRVLGQFGIWIEVMLIVGMFSLVSVSGIDDVLEIGGSMISLLICDCWVKFLMLWVRLGLLNFVGWMMSLQLSVVQILMILCWKMLMMCVLGLFCIMLISDECFDVSVCVWLFGLKFSFLIVVLIFLCVVVFIFGELLSICDMVWIDMFVVCVILVIVVD